MLVERDVPGRTVLLDLDDRETSSWGMGGGSNRDFSGFAVLGRIVVVEAELEGPAAPDDELGRLGGSKPKANSD